MFRRNVHEAPRRALGERGDTVPLVDASTGSASIDLHMNVLRPGGPAGAYHYHSNADDLYYVLSGSGQLVVEGTELIVGSGDVVFIPRGERHSIANAGTDDLVLLEIRSPADADFVVTEGSSPR